MAKHKSNKWIKNRFAGADGIYSRKYIRKTPQSIKECGEIIKCLTGNNK